MSAEETMKKIEEQFEDVKLTMGEVTKEQQLRRKKCIDKATQFKIYPMRNKKEYFNVLVFDTIKTMKAYVKDTYAAWHPGEDIKMWAMTEFFTAFDSKTGKQMPVIGEILMCKEALYYEVAAHEAMHATMLYMTMMWEEDKILEAYMLREPTPGRKGKTSYQEAACWIHTELFNGMLKELKKANVGLAEAGEL